MEREQLPLIKGRDIVITGLQPWYYEIGSNCKNIATYFAKHNRVLYVNLPIKRKPYLSKNKNVGIQQHCDIIKAGKNELQQVSENMWQLYPLSIVESINSLPSNKLFTLINYFNNRRFAKNIQKALHQLDFKNVILFNDNDIYNSYFLKELLNPATYIYYCRDFLQGYDYWKKHTSILEPKLISKSDLAVANSSFYADYCAKYNSNAHYIGQGCDLSLFDGDKEYALPEDMHKISKPVIGYVGAIDSARLDEIIIKTIALARPEWNVVLVGPEDAFFAKSELHTLPNIYFLGRKPMQQLPQYIAAFDACINPQLKNIITRGNYPLKIDEYLAMGKPVVATRTETMKLFESHTYLADRPEEYPGLIEKALQDTDAGKCAARISFAKSHTWENCMAELYKAILNT